MPRLRAFSLLVPLLLVVAARAQGTPPEPPRPRLVAQVGHDIPTDAVALSADGRVAATSAWDGSVRIWDARLGVEVRRIGGDTLALVSPSLSADGRRMAALGPEGVTLWDVASGTLVRAFGEGEEVIGGPLLSGDGRLVLAGSGTAVTVWDAETGQALQHLGRGAHGIALSLDGSTAGTIGGELGDESLEVWDVATGHVRRRIDGIASGPVQSLTIRSDGAALLVHEEGEGAELWDLDTGTVVNHFTSEAGEVVAATLSPGGDLVLTVEAEPAEGGARERVWLWDARTGRRVRALNGDGTPILGPGVSGVLFHASAALSADGSHALTAGLDATPRFWSTRSGSGGAVRGGRAVPISGLTFVGDRLVTAGRNPRAHLGEVRVWDLESGARRWSVGGAEAVAVALSADGRTAVTVETTPPVDEASEATGAVRVWDAEAGRERHRLGPPDLHPRHATLSADGRVAAAVLVEREPPGPERAWSAWTWDTASGRVLHRIDFDATPVRSVHLARDGSAALLTDYVDPYLKDQGATGAARLWDLETGQVRHVLGADPVGVDAAALSADGRLVVTAGTALRTWDAETGALLRQFGEFPGRTFTVVASEDGRLVVTHDDEGRLKVWDTETGVGRVLRDYLWYDEYDPLDEPPALAVSDDGRLVAIAGADGVTALLDARTGAELASLLSFDDGSWLVVTPDGRFDAPDLERVSGAVWVAPDDPLTPLPIEAFMADFYEPRLLPRALAGEAFREVGSLLERNRVPPTVEITGVRLAADGTASVTVAVEGTSREYGGTVHEGGAYDLRLFRAGQLVGWADGELVGGSGRRTFTFDGVAAPTGADTLAVSAYAFNVDRVKSRTAYADLAVPSEAIPERPRRAYVVSLGVDAFAESAWDLAFAAADARAYQAALDSTLGATGDYDEVVAVALVSARDAAATSDATAAALRGALARLAGDEPDPEAAAALGRVPGAERLAAATPDDVVVVTASTHGYAAPDGVFYLLPADVPASGGRAVTPELLEAAVSSDELSAWFRGVDAGTLALVVDACHAAGAVEGTGFKPGPMGARGLGQLAFDKGMAVLTATQAAAPALEAASTGRGLLTFALVENGLLAGQADGAAEGARDGRITLGEWLAYGVARVPGLSEEVRTGAVETYGRGGGVTSRALPPDVEGTGGGLQTPALFDFRRGARGVLVAR